MTADQWVSLLRAIADLLSVLIWPALLVFVLVKFATPLGEFLGNLREVTAKAGGVEISAQRQEAVAALGAAIAQAPEGRETSGEPSQAAGVIERAVPDSKAFRRLQGARVLWVDDRPDNNRFERQSLEALGIQFSLSTSTADALANLDASDFDLVISDMGRPPDARAGYTLLDAMRERGDQTPVVFYAGSRTREHIAESRKHGAIGTTNSPTELIGMVTQSLSRGR